MEYKRLMYFPQKIEITKERISQYEKQYQNLLNQQTITKKQSALTQKQYQRNSVLPYLPNMQGQSALLPKIFHCSNGFSCRLRKY